MDFVEIMQPPKPISGNLIFGSPIPPIQRLKSMSEDEFEYIVWEWAHSYLTSVYTDVKRIGGAGDKGRDVICYTQDGNIVIYQCKHYQTTLSPSKFWIELGKLCYYTYNKDYEMPLTYYIVASSGIGQSLSNLIDNPHKINAELIKNWDTCCKSKITKTNDIIMDGAFKKYVEKFDFSIVKSLSELTLLEQYESTPWFKYRFGGGLMKKPKPVAPPQVITDDEKKLNYIKQLISVYKEYTSGQIDSFEAIKNDGMINDHFTRQRICYHSSQTLKRFSRDELLEEVIYDDIKNQVFNCVIDISLEKYENGYKKLSETLREARRISLVSNELGNISPDDRCGMCHELVNDERLRWVNENEEY